MPMLVRAASTTNAHERRQRLVLPSSYKSNELDNDYLQALKLIDQTRRQTDSPSQKKLHRADAIKQKRPKYSSFQFSSTLTPIGQEAMIKTYEDTIVSHLANVYSSKRISKVLPRLPTATFRERLPIIKNSQTRLENIHQAQHLIDNIINHDMKKDELLCNYVRWQQKWTQYI